MALSVRPRAINAGRQRAGLSVIVDAVESQGPLNLTQQWLAWTSHSGKNPGTLVLGFVVGIGSAVEGTQRPAFHELWRECGLSVRIKNGSTIGQVVLAFSLDSGAAVAGFQAQRLREEINIQLNFTDKLHI